MPLYDYKCDKCSHRFELRQPFGSESVLSCPQCGSEAHRQYHSMAIIYKGSGFYTTDYARKHISPAGETSSPNGASDDSKAGDSKAGDSKGDESKNGDPSAAKPKADSKAVDSKTSDSKSGSSAESAAGTSSGSSSGGSHGHPH